MKKLKMNEKIAITNYIVGEYHLAGLDLYADAGRFPTSKDRNYEPQNVLISDALNLNFNKDVYNNKEYSEACSSHTGIVEVRDFLSNYGGMWHLGDVLTDVVATECIRARNENLTITEDFIDNIYNKLNEIFSGFLKVFNDSKNRTYVEAPVTYNGVQLYQKVEK